MFSKWIKEHKIISILVIVFLVAAILLGITRASGGTTKLGPLNRIYMLIETRLPEPMLVLNAVDMSKRKYKFLVK